MPTAAAAPGQDRERHSMQPRRPAAHHGITTLASKSNPQATRRAASLKGARARGSCCRRSRSRSRAGRARLGELEAQKAASRRLGVRRRARPLGLAVWSPAGRGCHGAPALTPAPIRGVHPIFQRKEFIFVVVPSHGRPVKSSLLRWLYDP